MNIRPAAAADIAAIARVHVDSWRTTYAGMVPQSYLDSLRYEDRERLWERALAEGSSSSVFVAEEDGRVVGFASCGPARADAPDYEGELYAVYLLKEYQGRGIGRALFDAVVRTLLQRGMRSMAIWVLADNPACGFYERMGGRRVYGRDEELQGIVIHEVGYGWDDMSDLAANAPEGDQ